MFGTGFDLAAVESGKKILESLLRAFFETARPCSMAEDFKKQAKLTVKDITGLKYFDQIAP